MFNIEKVYNFLFSLNLFFKKFFWFKKATKLFLTLSKYMENLTISKKIFKNK